MPIYERVVQKLMSNGQTHNKGSLAATIATVLIAVAAAAAVAAVLILTSGKNEPSEPESASSPISDELVSECSAAAQELVQKNYKVIKLFATEGLKYKTVYGNPSEDGYYSVDDEEYKHYSQIEELVKSVYVASEAERILTRYPVGTESGAKDVQIYKEHKDPVDGEECLGISESFVPETDYARDWSKCVIKISPKSDTECALTVIADGVAEAEADAHPESVMTTRMVKQDGKWLLSNLLK